MGDPVPTTKQRIVAAALETLREDGFAGTSARAIARRGGFNQALIFYHFGTLNDLLLAALDETSARRMERYQTVMDQPGGLAETLQLATDLYREDLESGHITVISEMVAGSLGRDDLAPEVVARMDPWVEFAEDKLRTVLADAGLDAVIPARTAAFAIVSLYLGIDLLSHLDTDGSRVDALFESANTVAPMLAGLLGARR